MKLTQDMATVAWSGLTGVEPNVLLQLKIDPANRGREAARDRLEA